MEAKPHPATRWLVVRMTSELFEKRWLAPSASSKNYRVVPRPRSADYGKKAHFTNSVATMTASELFAATGADKFFDYWNHQRDRLKHAPLD